MTIIATIDVPTVSDITSTVWEEIARKEFTLEQAGDFMISISAELTNASTNRIAGIRVLLDGDEIDPIMMHHTSPLVAGEYQGITRHRFKTLQAGLHALTMEGRTSNASYATSIRGKCLWVIKR